MWRVAQFGVYLATVFQFISLQCWREINIYDHDSGDYDADYHDLCTMFIKQGSSFIDNGILLKLPSSVNTPSTQPWGIQRFIIVFFIYLLFQT